MNQKSKDELISILTKEIESIQDNIDLLCLNIEIIEPSCSVGYDERFELLESQAVTSKNIEILTVRLHSLKHALKNIDNKKFGICNICDEEISFERLKISPDSKICVECLDD